MKGQKLGAWRAVAFGLALAVVAGPAAPAGAAGVNRVYISEILLDPAGPDAGNQYVELTNLGSTTVDLSTWSICTQVQYRQFPHAARIAPFGTFMIYPNRSGPSPDSVSTWYTGPYVTLTLNAGSFGLYHAVGGYTTPARMEDFVEWGQTGQHLENVAVAAGIWPSGPTAGGAVALPGEGLVIGYRGTKRLPHFLGDVSTPSDYDIEAPSPQELNPSFSTPLPIALNEVLADAAGAEPGRTFFEITNLGPSIVPLSFLHWRYGTAGGADLSGTFPADLTLGGFGYLVIHLNADGTADSANVYTGASPDLDPAGGSLALYKGTQGDDDPANLLDFAEWGAAGQPREALAVTAGQWAAGEFIPTPGDGRSIDYHGTGEGAPSWCPQIPPTPGEGTNCLLIGVPEDGGGPAVNRLTSAPNPFRGWTRIRTAPRQVGQARQVGQPIGVRVYDVTGRLVRRLFEGAAPADGLDLIWDGRDDAGRSLPAGMYWAELRGDGERLVRRMVLAR